MFQDLLYIVWNLMDVLGYATPRYSILYCVCRGPTRRSVVPWVTDRAGYVLLSIILNVFLAFMLWSVCLCMFGMMSQVGVLKHAPHSYMQMYLGQMLKSNKKCVLCKGLFPTYVVNFVINVVLGIVVETCKSCLQTLVPGITFL